MRRTGRRQRCFALRHSALLRVGALTAMTCGFSNLVFAHTLSESISSWQVYGSSIHVQLLIPDLEAKRLSPSGQDLPAPQIVAQYLRTRLGATAGGKQCALESGPRALQSAPGFSRYETAFTCPQSQDIKVHSSVFYDIVPSHTDFARIQDAAGNFHEELLTRNSPEAVVTADAAASPLQQAGLLDFVRMGVMHIFTGVDHMSFMLGLVLISRRLRDLLFVITGFTIGHSVTLALAVSGIVRPDAGFIDSLVALTITLIGAENIAEATRRPLPVALGIGALLCLMAIMKTLGASISLPMTLLLGGALFCTSYLLLTGQVRDAGRIRLLVTLVFGLIHGFGFAANLLEMRLPADRLAPLLFGFNVGVEMGQLTVVLGALLVARGFAKLRLSMPRPLFADLAASFLVGEGLFWFIGRSVSLG